MNAATRRWRWATALAATAVLVLAACGSQVPPNEFVGANGYGNGGGGASSVNSACPSTTAARSSAPASHSSSPSGHKSSSPAKGHPSSSAPKSSASPQANSNDCASGSGNGTGTGLVGGNAGTGGTGGGTGGGGTGGGGTGGGSGGGGGSQVGGGAGNPLAGVKAGSCAGFKNGPGITNSTITIANEADLSGPVAGLFKSASAATTAFVSYFNSSSSICGRKLKLESLDSGTSESGDQQASQTACDNAFAMVGSMGAFDAGGASTVAKCGIPDIRAASTETARQQSPVTFGAYSLNTSEIPTAAFSYFKSLGDAYQHAAFVYLDAGASSLNAKSFIAGEEKMGYNFVYQQAICITCGLIPWDSYATNIKNKGVKYVQYIGSAEPYAGQLKAAMDQAGVHPLFVMDPTGYSNSYTSSGSQTKGTYSFIPSPLYLNSSEVAKNPGLATYLQWLQRTSGGAPDFYGVFAWVAAALFTQIAIELGGKLSRASMVAALRGIHNYTNNGMVPPQDVGGKQTPKCMSVAEFNGSSWDRKTPYPYTCGSLVNSGVS